MKEIYIIFTYALAISKYSYLYINGRLRRILTYDVDTSNITVLKNLIQYYKEEEIKDTIIYTNWRNLANVMNKQTIENKKKWEQPILMKLYEEYNSFNNKIEYVSTDMLGNFNKLSIALRINDIKQNINE